MFANCFAIYFQRKTIITANQKLISTFFKGGNHLIDINKKVITCFGNVTQFGVAKFSIMLEVKIVNHNNDGGCNLVYLIDIGNSYAVFTDNDINVFINKNGGDPIHNCTNNQK